MIRVLFLDDDAKFILKAQKLLPQDSEWLATRDVDKAKELCGNLKFDLIVVRKRNRDMLIDLLSKMIEMPYQNKVMPFGRLVILPQLCWWWYLRKIIVHIAAKLVKPT